ncbi:MAG TPA: hypothetical protein V6C71_00810 [Coleofasciculaceae cyanobacterium]
MDLANIKLPPIIPPQTLDEVDPTKANLVTPTVILGAVHSFKSAIAVLTQVADLTRRTNGAAVILDVTNNPNQTSTDKFGAIYAKFAPISPIIAADAPTKKALSKPNLKASSVKVSIEPIPLNKYIVR